METISFDDFLSLYSPYSNMDDKYSKTYGYIRWPDSTIEDRNYIRSMDENIVWTIVYSNENPEQIYILPGYRTVNRLGFVITLEPWPNNKKSSLRVLVKQLK